MSVPQKAVLGSRENFWRYSSVEGYDLTHPPTPESPKVHPHVPLETTTARVAIDPQKTALLIIDMQNFFLSPCLGKPKDGNGIKACNQLLHHAIPACRKAGIQVLWLNWGLTEEDIENMPPATLRAFGFSTVADDSRPGADGLLVKKDPRLYKGLGSELGEVVIEDGSKVQAGRLLMRNQWNSFLYTPLEESRQQSLGGSSNRQDVCIDKNRISGLWGDESPCSRYLDSMGIRSLLFAGVNTDQCVNATLLDAFEKGYDCFLLSDGCGTSSPEFSKQCVELNAAKLLGFVLSCEDLAKGVENMIH